MSYSSRNWIELLEVSRENNIYSSLVSYSIGGEKLKLRFGIEKLDFGLLKRILEYRPFENTGVAPYRYFFNTDGWKDEENKNLGSIRIGVEQMERQIQHEFKLSRRYISNILWFYSLSDKKEVEGLIEV